MHTTNMVEMKFSILRASHLRCEGRDRVLFDIASLSLEPGVTLVQGPEGCGKSTLLRVLAGVQHLPGSDLWRAPDTQTYWANPHTDADEQSCATAYFEALAPQYPDWNTALLHEFADAVGMTAHWDKPLYMLSTGTKRKVWLCAAVASGAALTLLDEPFAALDARSIATLLEVLTEATTHTRRAWVVADYLPPRGVPLAQTIMLGE